MRRMNFEQRPVQSRDLGGLPGSVLLVLATWLVALMLAMALRGPA
jgi:hypothetical protein